MLLCHGMCRIEIARLLHPASSRGLPLPHKYVFGPFELNCIAIGVHLKGRSGGDGQVEEFGKKTVCGTVLDAG